MNYGTRPILFIADFFILDHDGLQNLARPANQIEQNIWIRNLAKAINKKSKKSPYPQLSS